MENLKAQIWHQAVHLLWQKVGIREENQNVWLHLSPELRDHVLKIRENIGDHVRGQIEGGLK